MRRSFRFKIYRSRNSRYLDQQIDVAGIIYNHCIALHRRYYRLFGKNLNINKLQKHITKLKKLSKYQFWKNVGSQAIQEITERIKKGYDRFFDNVKARKEGKTKERVSPPKFRKVRKYKSFTLKQAGWKLEDNGVLVIRKRRYKYAKSREIEGTIKTVNIKRDAVGDFWVSFSCDIVETLSRAMTGKSAGFDFGLKTFLTSSEAVDPIRSPLFHREALASLKQSNRKLSKKKKGSRNRAKAKLNLARTHRRVSNLRNDYQWKLAKNFAIEYDHMFFEDLNIKAMSRLWGRKVHDLGFDKFLKKLGSKAHQFGAEVHKIDRFFPSSKKCSYCDYIKDDLALTDREYHCLNCGISLDRDKNAAFNIKMVGASTIGLEVVRPSIDGVLDGVRTKTPESPGFSHG